MKRTVTPELLDSDSGTSTEIATSLADLERINRWFGGVSTLASLVRQVAAQTGHRRFTMLDVGAGAGDVARMLREQVRGSGIELDVSLLDRSAFHFARTTREMLAEAQARTPVPHESGRALAADALALPFRERSFDLVACSTFAHHLELEELIQFVNRALTVARAAVLINDLRRSAAHLALVYMGFPLFRSRITRHDGPVSVRRAYTPKELSEILQQTRAVRIEISNHYLYRMGAIAWVH